MVNLGLRALLALHPPISPLTSSGQRNCASWASQPQKSVTLLPCPGGRTTKSTRTKKKVILVRRNRRSAKLGLRTSSGHSRTDTTSMADVRSATSLAQASCSAPTVGETAKWKCIMYNMDKNRVPLCSVLKGKSVFSALYVTCIPTLN